jgi:hypothetical protein
LDSRAEDGDRVDDGESEVSGGDGARGGRAQIGQVAAIEQDAGRRAGSGVERQHHAIVPSGEARGKFAGVPVATVQMTSFDMDLTSMLGYVEMDHTRELGATSCVRREGLLDGGDARRRIK